MYMMCFMFPYLSPSTVDGDRQDAPAPILVDGEVEYEVDSIVGHRISRGVR